MKIYTRKGDKGQTSLIGGTRVPKYHLRIETYGTVDELNSLVGLVCDHRPEPPAREVLREVQHLLFTIGASLASDPERGKMELPELTDQHIETLEQEMDRMNESLPELKNFVLPGGHPVASYCHIARCVCRRAERMTVQLAESEKVDERIIRYLNRLSDYLFVLAREICQEQGGEEVLWNPRGK